ncbi:NAD(+) synthase [Anaerobranca gottschalkii]|uniref:NH(3)-dependent NAD(+) synthetase n=1 Tax=Anaerobranca gottschalkii DSM 13577 TaxID=1120990 RepID=A0A1I0BHJ7_9FIRM|nr:NAD(+) synthase [Anaerobranca gottschalkii]SET06290.1 NAD+ synthase [Anaerobranca gottschalkii DSM 13577]
MDYSKEIKERVEFIRDYVHKAGGKGVVLGVSGGKDSAVVAALAKKAFPQTSFGVIMPCHSLQKDIEHGKLLCESIGLEYTIVDLTEAYETLLKNIPVGITDISKANIKPRLRMTTLYAIAQSQNALVLGTGNRTEITLGYFTKHGDGACDINPISDLTVGQVFDMARELNIPKEIIEKPPSAGLWEGQTDEGELGLKYADVDNYLLTGQGSQELIERVKYLNRVTEHKRKGYAQFRDYRTL